jgi:negative regulator of flagellin synthesis FlgM
MKIKKQPINSLRAKRKLEKKSISWKKKGDAVMRIEAYNQVAQVYKSGKSSKTQNTYAAAAGRDEVTISQAGYDYQVAKKAVAEASDIREDKVAQLKARVESGNYKIDSGDFASKLLEKYNALQ